MKLKGRHIMNRALVWVTSLTAALSIALTACSSGSESSSLFGGAGASRSTESDGGATQASVAIERSGSSAATVAQQSADGSGAGIDPCRLVTADEAKAALGGRQPKAAKHTDFLGDPQCLYEEPEDGDVVSIVVDATNHGREA